MMAETVDGPADILVEMTTEGGVRFLAQFPDQKPEQAAQMLALTPSEADALTKQLIGILQKTYARWGRPWIWNLPNGKVQAARIRSDGVLEYSMDCDSAEVAVASLG